MMPIKFIFERSHNNMDYPPKEKREEGSKNFDHLSMEEVIHRMKQINEEQAEPSEDLSQLIEQVQKKIVSCQEVDLEKVKDLILRHAFFRNPNHYHIRLITIMKHLKKKGIDISIPDFDLLVDEIIVSLPGVKKIGGDRYAYKK